MTPGQCGNIHRLSPSYIVICFIWFPNKSTRTAVHFHNIFNGTCRQNSVKTKNAECDKIPLRVVSLLTHSRSVDSPEYLWYWEFCYYFVKTYLHALARIWARNFSKVWTIAVWPDDISYFQSRYPNTIFTVRETQKTLLCRTIIFAYVVKQCRVCMRYIVRKNCRCLASEFTFLLMRWKR